MGDLKIQNDLFTIFSPIDIGAFSKAEQFINYAITNYTTKCQEIKSDCSIINEVEKKKKEFSKSLGFLYEQLGKKVDDPRPKRDLGMALGNIGMNFGIENHKAIGHISEEIDKLRRTFSQNFDIIKSEVNRQDEINKILEEKLKEVAKKVHVHENQLNIANGQIDKLAEKVTNLTHQVNNLNLETLFSEIRIIIFEIFDKLTELKQTVTNMQTNTLSSSVISPEGLMRRMQAHVSNDNFIATPHLNNYPKIAKTVFGDISLDLKSEIIHIFIHVPLYLKTNRFYEVVNLPIIKDRNILRLGLNEKYCVLSEDKSKYYCTNKNPMYEQMDDFYFCRDPKEVPFLPTSRRTKCIVNILRSRSFENCSFQEIPQNIEVFQKIEPNTILFAVRDSTKYNFECNNETQSWNNFDRNEYIAGTGVIYLGPGCKFYTEDSNLNSDAFNKFQDKQKRDLYRFGMDGKVNQEFKTHSFIADLPKEKVISTFENLKYLRSSNDDDNENEID